jgi:hypothetical protein
MRSFYFVLASLFLSGCGTAVVATAPTIPTATEWKALHQNIYSTFTSLKIPGAPEISPLHTNDALGTPADSAVCLRASDGGKSEYLVFLIRQNKVVDFRSAVKLDRCDEQRYALLGRP